MMRDREEPRRDRPFLAVRSRAVWDAAHGREWRVWAADCRSVPGHRGDQCLIFDCGTTVRRVWTFPDDWERLPDHTLLAMIEGPATR
jgi:hypothetical protein